MQNGAPADVLSIQPFEQVQIESPSPSVPEVNAEAPIPELQEHECTLLATEQVFAPSPVEASVLHFVFSSLLQLLPPLVHALVPEPVYPLALQEHLAADMSS